MLGAAVVLGGYLLGSVSFGLVIARRRGVDLRAVGSGNIGATNVGRALGKRAGRMVMLLDGLKGLVPVIASRVLLPGEPMWIAAAGVAAVVGHLLPVWHGFRGGKGVATTAGVMLGAVPAAGVLMAITYGLVKKATGTSSLGSLAGTGVALVATIVLTRLAPWPDPPSVADWLTAMASVIATLVLVAHRSNLRRLARGEEPPAPN